LAYVRQKSLCAWKTDSFPTEEKNGGVGGQRANSRWGGGKGKSVDGWVDAKGAGDYAGRTKKKRFVGLVGGGCPAVKHRKGKSGRNSKKNGVCVKNKKEGKISLKNEFAEGGKKGKKKTREAI